MRPSLLQEMLARAGKHGGNSKTKHAPFPLAPAGDAGSRLFRCPATKEMRPSLSRLHLQEMLARAGRHGVAPISWEEMGEQKDLIAFSHGGVLCHGEVG